MMAARADQVERVAIIAAVIAKAPQTFGRTALMKCLYFLQTLRNVPLGYDFQLYTYGPFDSDVLSDLRLAEQMEAVESKLKHFPNGYAYELQGTSKATSIVETSDFVSRYRDEIEWVIGKFGSRSALDLEKASTLIFVDRAISDLSLHDLAIKVLEVKPHLALDAIEREARRLQDEKLLRAEAS